MSDSMELGRIAEALERIACALEGKKNERQTKPGRVRKTNAVAPSPDGIRSAALIGAYCEAYKRRYGANPIIDGKTQGLARGLARSIGTDRLGDLVTAFVQMDDPYFKTRCHDFVTFTQNLSKVAVALFNGTNDPQEKDFWKRVWGGDDQGQLPAAGETTTGQLGGEELSAGANQSLLEGPAAHG